MKKTVSSIYPYGVNQYKEKAIGEMGLEIICDIESSEIEYDNNKLTALFETVKKKCENRHVWVLYGSDDRESWIPLQIGSVSAQNVISEIKGDFVCMTPYSEKKDLKPWSSYYYDSVLKIKYGFDAKCQKYQKMKEMCKYLAVAILTDEETLDEVKDKSISKYQKKECDIASKIQPLFWNPVGKEHAYLDSLNSDLK